MNEAIEKAVKVAGGPQALADAIGKTRQTIYNWRRRGFKVSAEDAVAIDKVFGVPRKTIRPDLFE